MKTTIIRTALALATAFGALCAHADAGCAAAHPALARAAACVQQPGIDANTFIVMPPATTRWLASADADTTSGAVMASAPHVRANYAHPAVAVARMQRTAVVDANTFIVQPPVTVSWTVMPQDSVYASVPSRAPVAR